MAQYMAPDEARKAHRTGEPMHFRHDRRIKRTHCVTATTFGMSVLLVAVALLGSAPIQPEASAAAPSGLLAPLAGLEGTEVFDVVEARARALAAEPYQPSKKTLPPELANMSYEQYRAIQFREDRAVWHNESLFEIQLFHPGFLYREPVNLHVLQPGDSASIEFDRSYFRYVPPVDTLAEKVPDGLGFAGFRVHYPLSSEHKTEFLVFLGASYFRLIGPGQVYGASARGLAIDTATAPGEEFPAFREFWLVKPHAEQNHLVIYALLDSPSVAGAYRFEVTPGTPTEMLVEARLFARTDVEKLGIAPLTSMYHHGENTVRQVDDFRPEVHDSDGLLMAVSNGEWIWRPLSNHRALKVSSLADENPRGFGLLQRDRDFNHYLDMEARYELRPSLWVVPEGDWGKGRVELVEIPTDNEFNDNIVAYWVPEKRFKAGDSRQFSYRLRSFDHLLPEATSGHVLRTRIGADAIPGQSNPPSRGSRRFVVDFHAGSLDSLTVEAPIQADLQNSSGRITDLRVTPLPDGKTWRASFQLAPEGDKLVDMRMSLALHGRRLTEVWSYVWYPDALQ
jgi:periplasmic glucans biosynthesis protein